MRGRSLGWFNSQTITHSNHFKHENIYLAVEWFKRVSTPGCGQVAARQGGLRDWDNPPCLTFKQM